MGGILKYELNCNKMIYKVEAWILLLLYIVSKLDRNDIYFQKEARWPFDKN
jgi:hypothetical protein